MNRPGAKIDTERYLIKSEVARRMDLTLWRLNQIIKSLGGFPPETYVTDQRDAAERWIEK